MFRGVEIKVSNEVVTNSYQNYYYQAYFMVSECLLVSVSLSLSLVN